ncbi:hypothetical protein [Candidatus Magnetobacterium casense]|uniref:Uncharacterized protein n=1 Tax=Candidatus Magnetobacterium casense TaxID=1455061 RepID=A0ABS6S2F1_9BACT|nr:hypothetical protein [Candidatus Magnetobacterium casensis]MBV6343021.1 hypothetical protein [Candidatus Magnetobacterium casensis]
MAQEEKRGCGYRHVGGLYLCGEYISVPCDRLPYPLDVCPVCGAGVKVSRGFTKINPLALFGIHQPCEDKWPGCFVCEPKGDPAFIMGVGERYYKTPGDFMAEGARLGLSKRIPFIPKELELGKTIVYLAHPKACQAKEPAILQQAMAIVCGDESSQPRMVESEKAEYKLGIFSAFVPMRVEKLIWEHEATPEELEKLQKRGITPVVIKDGDPDHAPKEAR